MTTPPAADLDAARLLLERLGVTPEQLLAEPAESKPVPTFADYVPVVADAVSAGTLRVYGSYWNRIVEKWGERRLNAVTASEISALCAELQRQRVQRRNGRGGHSTVEHFVAAIRCLYKHAANDTLISADANPALKVAKPRRLPSTRHAIIDTRLAEINDTVATTGDDPELDALLLRLHTETAGRRGGALALRPEDLDEDQCLILLREKGGTHRVQPVSPTLMRHLLQHAEQRQASRDGQLLRYRNSSPITRRRYDYLWDRVKEHLAWARMQQVSTHWLRHTTLTWIERNFGHAVAHAYAGHTNANDSNTTNRYTTAGLPEIATALAALTGEPHPLSPESQ